jgi:hypothetical protein
MQRAVPVWTVTEGDQCLSAALRSQQPAHDAIFTPRDAPQRLSRELGRVKTNMRVNTALWRAIQFAELACQQTVR